MGARQPAQEQGERLIAMSRFLQEEHRLYGRLMELACGKQKVLVEGRLDDLENLVQEEQAVLKSVAALEEDRYALQCDLALTFGVSPSELTVTRLAEIAGPAHGPSLQEAQQQLVKLIHELSAINQSNQELIQQSLAYISFAMDTVTGISSAPTYGKEGRRHRTRPALNIVNRKG